MLRFYLRFSLLPLALLTAVLLLIHAQPYDDHDLRQLIAPEGCSAPCFIGIRPGVTTKDDAIKLLEAHAWVAQTTLDYSSQISWVWSGSQPAVIDTEEKPLVNTSTTMDGKEIVYEIIIPTRVSMGSILLLVDDPESYMVALDRAQLGTRRANTVSLRYYDVRLEANTFCPSTWHDTLEQKAAVILYDPHNASFFYGEYFWDYRRFLQILKDASGCF